MGDKNLQIMLYQDKIVKWRPHKPYVPIVSVDFPTEIIYMIADMVPCKFIFVSHEYYNEFIKRAIDSWLDERFKSLADNFWNRLPKITVNTPYFIRCGCAMCNGYNIGTLRYAT